MLHEFRGERSKGRAKLEDAFKDHPIASAFMIATLDARPVDMTHIEVKANFTPNENTSGKGNCVNTIQISIQRLDVEL